ncbi:MAG: ferredoxin reductase [Dermatophilaceae bacterium]
MSASSIDQAATGPSQLPSTPPRRSPMSRRQAPVPLSPQVASPLRDMAHGLRRAAEALVTPLVPADYLDLVNPLRAGAELRGRVVAVHPETRDSATLVIRPGRSWQGHRPGQYVRVGVDVNGVRHWRAYSLTHRHDGVAAAGIPPGCIAITPKIINGGTVSTHLVQHTAPGTLLMLDQATGDFVLPHPLPRRVLFLTAGSGITPVIGMMRSHLPELADVAHVHCAPSAADVMFAAELRSLADAGRVDLTINLDDQHGILHLDRLDLIVPDWRAREAWVCGPTGLLEAAELHWEAAGVIRQLHTERFRPRVVEPGDGGRVRFTASGAETDADGATPILEAGERAGVLMPSGCRMGICFGCVATLRQGAVRDLRTGAVTVGEPGDNLRVQTCVNAVAGSCDIEL